MATGVSEKPWSDYTEADYSLEQWARACLITPSGTPTSKEQCKLPVRTPSGVLSRAGVHAAAAALAGARGGVNATQEEKDTAGKALLRLYAKLNEEAPESLKHEDVSLSADDLTAVETFLSHSGRKGMKWGQHVYALTTSNGDRRSVGLLPGTPKPRSQADKAGAEAAMHEVTAAHKVALTTAVHSLNSGEANRILKAEKPSISRDIKVSDLLHKQLNAEDPDFEHRVAFNRAGHILVVSTPKGIKHADMIPMGPSVTSTILVTYDENGYFTSAKLGETEIQHSDELSFLMHFGRKGMKWGQHIFSRGRSSSTSSTLTHPQEISDAQKAAAISAKIRKGGLEAASNQELQLLINRMNLQRQYADIAAQTSKLERGRKFMDRQLQTGRTANDMLKFYDSPAGRLLRIKMGQKNVDYVGKHAKVGKKKK